MIPHISLFSANMYEATHIIVIIVIIMIIVQHSTTVVQHSNSYTHIWDWLTVGTILISIIKCKSQLILKLELERIEEMNHWNSRTNRSEMRDHANVVTLLDRVGVEEHCTWNLGCQICHPFNTGIDRKRGSVSGHGHHVKHSWRTWRHQGIQRRNETLQTGIQN